MKNKAKLSYLKFGHGTPISDATTALKMFVENSQEDLQVYLKRTPPLMFWWKVSENVWSSYFFKTLMDEMFNVSENWSSLFFRILIDASGCYLDRSHVMCLLVKPANSVNNILRLPVKAFSPGLPIWFSNI